MSSLYSESKVASALLHPEAWSSGDAFLPRRSIGQQQKHKISREWFCLAGALTLLLFSQLRILKDLARTRAKEDSRAQSTKFQPAVNGRANSDLDVRKTQNSIA